MNPIRLKLNNVNVTSKLSMNVLSNIQTIFILFLLLCNIVICSWDQTPDHTIIITRSQKKSPSVCVRKPAVVAEWSHVQHEALNRYVAWVRSQVESCLGHVHGTVMDPLFMLLDCDIVGRMFPL